MRITRVVAIGIISVVALAACGSDSDESGSVDTQGTATQDTGAELTTAPPDTSPADSTPAAPVDTSGGVGTSPAGTDASAPTGAVGLQVLDTPLGDVVGDAEGYTVYLFMPDGQGDSTCYDECESNWPFVAEVTEVGEGLDASLLGTTERTTGETQATYNGWPLYGFSGDVSPGDTSGQGVGGVWFALDAAGVAIES